MTEQSKPEDILEAVYQIVLQRKAMADGEKSYVKSLFDKGLDKILSKVGEEATETVMAAKDVAAGDGRDKDKLVYEVADLWFHCMVMLSHLDMDIDEVLDCLGERFGVSGLEEKAARNPD